MPNEGLERLLSLEPRARVLHLGCGAGRQTIELALRGYRVLGLDDAEASLTEARQAAKSQRLNIHFLKSELTQIPYRDEFDAVVCLAGAFGRLIKERDDERALISARKALKPGGMFLLDLPNKERLMRHFEPTAWEQSGEGRGDVALDKASYNLETGRLETQRTLVGKDGGRKAVFLSERVYTLTEIKTLLAAAGLSYRQCWGDFDAGPYGMDSRRMIVLAHRPAERPRKAKGEELVSALRIKGRRKGR